MIYFRIVHHVADRDVAIVVLADDIQRKFKGGFVAAFEPPANACCIVGVDSFFFAVVEKNGTSRMQVQSLSFREPDS